MSDQPTLEEVDQMRADGWAWIDPRLELMQRRWQRRGRPGQLMTLALADVSRRGLVDPTSTLVDDVARADYEMEQMR